MYRTMEMRVEPKLSYPEKLIISGSKGKIWFGYFLFALKSILDWLKENLISSILKGICGAICLSLALGVVFGIIFLLSLIPGKIIGWVSAVGIGGILLYTFGLIARVMIKETVADLNEKANSLKESTLQKLGTPPQLNCELYGSPTRISLDELRAQIDEMIEKNEELTAKIRRLC